jgi:antitoxin MazE
MTELIKIGNSQGIRIPKPIIEQAKLSNKKLEFKIIDDGLLITPIKQPREGWKNTVEEALAQYDSQSLISQEDKEWLETPISTDDDLEW